MVEKINSEMSQQHDIMQTANLAEYENKFKLDFWQTIYL